MSQAEVIRKYNNSEKGKATHLRYRRTEKGKALSRRAKLKHYFDMTNKDYDKLLQKQKGCCAICKAHQTQFDKRLFIDHDHATGEVRGLLCCGCNMHLGTWELGKKKYSPEFVQKFQTYLETCCGKRIKKTTAPCES